MLAHTFVENEVLPVVLLEEGPVDHAYLERSDDHREAHQLGIAHWHVFCAKGCALSFATVVQDDGAGGEPLLELGEPVG